MDNLEETDKFLESYNQLRLSQEETETLNRPIICTEIEPVILKNSHTKGRTRWFHRWVLLYTYRLANTYPSETISKTAEEGTLPNSFYGAPIIPILKPDKDTTKKRKLQININDQHRHKNPQY